MRDTFPIKECRSEASDVNDIPYPPQRSKGYIPSGMDASTDRSSPIES